MVARFVRFAMDTFAMNSASSLRTSPDAALALTVTGVDLDGHKFSVLLDTVDVDSYHSGCYGWSMTDATAITTLVRLVRAFPGSMQCTTKPTRITGFGTSASVKRFGVSLVVPLLPLLISRMDRVHTFTRIGRDHSIIRFNSG